MAIPLSATVTSLLRNGPLIREASASGNVRVLARLLGPAYRGLIQRRGKDEDATNLFPGGPVTFDWRYRREHAELSRLYEMAKDAQWSVKALPWKTDVDPLGKRTLLPDGFIPTSGLRSWRRLTKAEKASQRHSMLSWLLSQFLHGEQGALFAAAQVVEAVPWLDAKLFGGTQVVDEARHVEVFHRYLTGKLEKLYEINDNLYVIVDAVMSDTRWDVKFLGMQIMIEGLALGSFGTIRALTDEPLLKVLLKYLITDEARHVHYGVLALKEFLAKELPEKQRREREDYAFELTLLMRNRFFAHEIYEEFYAHEMSRRAWNKLIVESEVMTLFRRTMFRRIVPNLKRIGLLSERLRPRYEALGLLAFEDEKAAPDLTARDLMRGS